MTTPLDLPTRGPTPADLNHRPDPPTGPVSTDPAATTAVPGRGPWTAVGTDPSTPVTQGPVIPSVASDRAPTPPTPATTPSAESPTPGSSRWARAGAALLLTLVALGVTVVICTPIALSSQDLIDWAGAPTGLALPGLWPVLVFCALDAAAGVCVLLSVYCAWRGEPPGAFAVLVWCFALGSAFANWRHSTAPGAAPDAVWFFPAMSLAGPALLETVLGRFRRWAQRDHGRRHRALPVFGWRRWIPALGSFRDTYGAWRTALLLDIDTVTEAISTYHRLCPDGSLRIATALRHHHAGPGTVPDDADHGDQDPDPTAHPMDPGEFVDPRARDLPVDLMRRIPVQDGPYQRWRTAWATLRTAPGDRATLAHVAAAHGFSLRQIEFIRRAGAAGLLDHPVPPAVRLATAALTDPTNIRTAADTST